MPLDEKLNKKNKELQKKIIFEIEKVERGKSKKNELQLQTILKELQNSGEGNMVFSYPRMIIDSWDFSDQLGIELIEFAELYKEIQGELRG